MYICLSFCLPFNILLLLLFFVFTLNTKEEEEEKEKVNRKNNTYTIENFWITHPHPHTHTHLLYLTWYIWSRPSSVDYFFALIFTLRRHLLVCGVLWVFFSRSSRGRFILYLEYLQIKERERERERKTEKLNIHTFIIVFMEDSWAKKMKERNEMKWKWRIKSIRTVHTQHWTNKLKKIWL